MVFFSASSADALCVYNGVENARTTLAQEYADSTWVVRAKVLAAHDHWSNTAESWTTYRILVGHSYKGHPRPEFAFFTYRDSGGFYLDRSGQPLPKGHDIGEEYLLFLNPNVPLR